MHAGKRLNCLPKQSFPAPVLYFMQTLIPLIISQSVQSFVDDGIFGAMMNVATHVLLFAQVLNVFGALLVENSRFCNVSYFEVL